MADTYVGGGVPRIAWKTPRKRRRKESSYDHPDIQ